MVALYVRTGQAVYRCGLFIKVRFTIMVAIIDIQVSLCVVVVYMLYAILFFPS